MVRKLINDNGLDPATITGTGLGGRITREDVLAVLEARGTPSADPDAVPAAAACRPCGRPGTGTCARRGPCATCPGTRPRPRPCASSRGGGSVGSAR